jgi:hypothetical protein
MWRLILRTNKHTQMKTAQKTIKSTMNIIIEKVSAFIDWNPLPRFLN